jgi:hypothetical protein
MNKIRITVHIQIINIKYMHSRTDNANQTNNLKGVTFLERSGMDKQSGHKKRTIK